MGSASQEQIFILVLNLEQICHLAEFQFSLFVENQRQDQWDDGTVVSVP